MNAKRLCSLLATACSVLAVLVPNSSQAQSNSQPGGIFRLGAYGVSGNYIGLQSNSDTLISLPFTRTPEFIGTIQSVSTNVVTVSGTPNWTPNQFVYNGATQPITSYALIGPGTGGATNAKQGCIYTVTANTANSVTLALNGDSIAAIPANSQITIIPYWTLGTLFPATNATVSFTPTVSTRSFQTQILIPNYSGTGVNLAYSETYYFYNSGSNIGWRLFGDAVTTDHSNDILEPSGYLVVRNSNNAPTLPLLVVGNVVSQNVTTPLVTQASAAQDNAVGLIRPVDVALNNSGLNSVDGSFVSTSSTRSIQDELLLYSNAQVALNKSPSATYFYMNGAWRLFGDATTVDHGTDLIPTGNAVTIRKAASGTGTSEFWTNLSPY